MSIMHIITYLITYLFNQGIDNIEISKPNLEKYVFAKFKESQFYYIAGEPML